MPFTTGRAGSPRATRHYPLALDPNAAGNNRRPLDLAPSPIRLVSVLRRGLRAGHQSLPTGVSPALKASNILVVSRESCTLFRSQVTQGLSRSSHEPR